MAKKLNGIPVIQSMPAFGGGLREGQRDVHHSLTTRQVENGYVTRETKYGTGQPYHEREYFHEGPCPEASHQEPRTGPSDAMKRAVEHLNR